MTDRTPKKRKISYRDLLEGKAPTPPAGEAPLRSTDAPLPSSESPLPSTDAPPAPRLTPRSAIAIAAELNRDAEQRRPTPVSTPLVVLEPPPVAPAPSAAAEESEDDDVTAALESHVFRERVRERHGRAELLLFRVGDEQFAASLGAIEEALESPDVHALPEMRGAMLGAFELRGRLLPIYDPAPILGIVRSTPGSAALVVRGAEVGGALRIGLAVDDVEDVLQVDLGTVREAPGTDDDDAVLLGVVRREGALVAIIDAEALMRACLADQVVETA